MDVAVIGTGVGGLCSLRHLSAHPDRFKSIVAFEQRNTIGGLWAYMDQTGRDEHGLDAYPSMYKDFRTMVPVEYIQYADFQHRRSHEPGSFLTHEEFLEYLMDYAEHFDLKKYIRFNTIVERVHPILKGNGAVKWDVQVRQVDKPDALTEAHYFDVVFVCNGRYVVPRKPDLPGLSEFQGTVIHTRDFRVPEIFNEQTVVMVGSGISGVDICVQVAECAKQVYLCHKAGFITHSSIFPSNVKSVCCIKAVKSRSVVLENGEEVKADAIFLCTGYKYSFPFLSEACHPTIKNARIFPLYKHLIHAEFPTMFFMPIVKLEPACPFANIQVQFAVATLLGAVQLPSKQGMLEDIQQDYQRRRSFGASHNQSHDMSPTMLYLKPYQEGLMALLEDETFITPIPDKMLAHLDKLMGLFSADIVKYRSGKYPLDIDWERIPTK